jgi:thiosulfate/3-mercaptopyruvate sulfurtransferase
VFSTLPVSIIKQGALHSITSSTLAIIVYCQSGARSSETAGVLQRLGFTNVKFYDSSWLGCGNTLDHPPIT